VICGEGVFEERTGGGRYAKDMHVKGQLVARSSYLRVVGVRRKVSSGRQAKINKKNEIKMKRKNVQRMLGS